MADRNGEKGVIFGGADVQVTGHRFTNTESIPNPCKS